MVEPRGLSVARSALQMFRLVRRIRGAAAAAAVAGLAAGCGGAASPTAPTPVSASLTTSTSSRALSPESAILDGLVQHDHGSDSWALGGVLVEVLEGEVITASTITDENGYFHFELPPGEVRLRGSKRTYAPTTTPPITVAAGQRTMTRFRIQQPYIPPAPLPPIPFVEWPVRTFSGRVSDMFGNPVASALVCATAQGGGSGFGACTSSDATGAYSVSFRVPNGERRTTTLDVSRAGYPKQQFLVDCCVEAEPIVFNVSMPALRVVRVELIGPTVVRLMVPVQLSALVTFEDGSAVTMTPIMLDVRGAIRNSPQGTGMIEGWSTGSGPAWWQYQGVGGGLTITVTP